MSTKSPPPQKLLLASGLLREIPLSLRLKTLLGGFYNQFGWGFAGFGSLLALFFVTNCAIIDLWSFRGDLQSVRGELTLVRKTSASEGGSKHRAGKPIFAYDYAFELENQRFEGTSYALQRNVKVGDTVRIEFPEGQPETSRIRGMRTRVFTSYVAFIGLFPIIGAGFFLYGLCRGLKTLRLLRTGNVCSGTLLEKKRTGGKVNNRHVYRFTFEYAATDDETYQAKASTHRPELLEDDESERLVYNPDAPADAQLLDHLPGPPSFDSEGELKPIRAGSILSSCITPSIVLLGHVAYFVVLQFIGDS